MFSFRYFVPFKQIYIFSTAFREFPCTKFHGNPSTTSRADTYLQTDGRDEPNSASLTMWTRLKTMYLIDNGMNTLYYTLEVTDSEETIFIRLIIPHVMWTCNWCFSPY